jgi:hypothetical protein
MSQFALWPHFVIAIRVPPLQKCSKKGHLREAGYGPDGTLRLRGHQKRVQNRSIAALEVGKHFGYLLLDRSLRLDTAIVISAALVLRVRGNCSPTPRDAHVLFQRRDVDVPLTPEDTLSGHPLLYLSRLCDWGRSSRRSRQSSYG